MKFYAQSTPYPYGSSSPWWPAGAYAQYSITNVDPSGNESAFGPFNDWGGLNYSLAYLVDIPTDSTGSTATRNVYRRLQMDNGFVQPAIYVGTIYDNTSTEYQEEPPPSTPTPAQVTQANTNLDNMYDWIDHCHDYMQDVINECYSYINESAQSDPGQQFTFQMLNDLLWGIGGIDFKGNALLSAFLANLEYTYVTQTPPTLQGVMGSVWERFDKTFLQSLDDLSNIKANLSSLWMNTWTNPINNTVTTNWCLGSPEYVVPAKMSVEFQSMTDAAIKAFTYGLAKYLLPTNWWVLRDMTGLFLPNGTTQNIVNMLQANPTQWAPYYFTWFSTTGGEICPEQGIEVCENFLGNGSDDPMFAGAAPVNLCDWLFIDDGYGNTLNSNGIATRHDVFCNWGLKYSLPQSAPNCNPFDTNVVPQPKPASTPLDVKEERKKAMKWHGLFDTEGRQAVERRLIEKAVKDPVFLRALVKNSKETLEKEIGLQIPAGIEFEVIQETPGKMKMVIPLIGAPGQKHH